MSSSKSPAPAAPAPAAPEQVPPPVLPARLAERVAALDTVGDLPLAEHAEAYQRLHTELQAELAEIDGG